LKGNARNKLEEDDEPAGKGDDIGFCGMGAGVWNVAEYRFKVAGFVDLCLVVGLEHEFRIS